MFRTPRDKAWFGWCMYDWANSAFATVILASVLPVYLAGLVPAQGATLSLFGLTHTLPASALWGYTVSFSMLLVAVSAPWLGARADHRGLRRRLLIVFGLIGAVATSLLCLTGPGDYLLVAGLFVVANVGFAAGNIFYNAFLPALAQGPELDRLSARGFALGYLGGGLMLLIAFVLIQGFSWFGFSDRAAATRAAFLLTGLWWGGFALPTFFFVREEVFVHPPGPLLKGLKGYLNTFAQIRRYPDLLIFLVAFLFYNDGIQTVIAVSAIFGREELGLSQTTILGTFLMIQFVAMPGSLLFGRAAERWGAKRAIMVGLVLFVAVTIYAYSMREGWEFWVLGFVVALIFGGCQAISRSLYAALIPPGKTAEFFAFYAISGKFASIFGPLVFALIADLTGSTRLSILALALFFLLGLVLLALVDVARGTAAAQGEMP
ncbi:MFS transporter [Desulfuromonas versatilis]|uniref:MFS transporter n=1 Tax=Desulfuromonas versatilis TaxID=2802975 RepID=A0ABM8HX42_9BACT|nr:MFS transporter [Desulfuromonas versatilis]BCR05355.1 MFS transporter [Desulfuromonas versatilis]